MTRFVAFDTETHLGGDGNPGQAFPRLVCVSAAWDDRAPELYDRGTGLLRFAEWVADPDVVLVGHHVSYDLGVIAAERPDLLESIFAALDAGRIRDTMIRAMLLDIASGAFQEDGSGKKRRLSYSLAACAERYLHVHLEKEDTWRKHYAYLDGVPLAEWPADARQYALDDAARTLDVYRAQEQIARGEGSPTGEIPDEARQVSYAEALHLMAGWGVRTDGEAVARLRETLEAEQVEAAKILTAAGILRANGTKNMAVLRRLVAEDYARRGVPPPRTLKGSIQTGAEVLDETDHPALLALAESAHGAKLLSTYVPALERGVSVPCTSRPNVLVASGRTSWSEPNWQNPPRKGGIRECVIPRPGNVFVFVDFDTIELKALAQSCLERFGYSEMAAALRRGEDLHVGLAAEMLGLDYPTALARYKDGDPLLDDARQAAKAGNFGLPGGMGAPKFAWAQRDLVARLGIVDPLRWATDLKAAALRKWYELPDHFADAARVADGDGRRIQAWSGRVRGGLDYCAAANDAFQGRVADGAKLALYRLTRECYVGRGVLRGSRPVLFLHDEIGTEVREEVLHDAAQAKLKIMIDAMAEVIPDIPITGTPVAVRRWYKGAKPVYIDGRLVPSRPEKGVDGKVRWVADLLTDAGRRPA